jgi:hypothetical protein
LISTAFSLLKSLGELRDGLIVAGGIMYVVGYLVWSFTAWRNHLGWLPAFKFQYFVAGFFPSLAVGLSVLLWKAMELGPYAHAYIYGHFSMWERLGGGVALIALSSLLMYSLAKSRNRLSQGVLLVLMLVMFASVMLLASGPGLVSELLWFLTFIELLMFLEAVHSELPQELGGFRERKVRLEMNRDDVSAQTLNELFPDLKDLEHRTVRSCAVTLYPSLDEYLLVRLKNSQGRTYQIKRETVLALITGEPVDLST